MGVYRFLPPLLKNPHAECFTHDRYAPDCSASPAGLRQGSLAMDGSELPVIKLITAAFAHDRCVQKGGASTSGLRSGSPYDRKCGSSFGTCLLSASLMIVARLIAALHLQACARATSQ